MSSYYLSVPLLYLFFFAAASLLFVIFILIRYRYYSISMVILVADNTLNLYTHNFSQSYKLVVSVVMIR